jgi:hypothetical protein
MPNFHTFPTLPETLVQQGRPVHVQPVDELLADIGQHQTTPGRDTPQRSECRSDRVLGQVLRDAFPDEERAGSSGIAMLRQRAEQVVALEVQGHQVNRAGKDIEHSAQDVFLAFDVD